jgi:hypothetical protein
MLIGKAPYIKKKKAFFLFLETYILKTNDTIRNKISSGRTNTPNPKHNPDNTEIILLLDKNSMNPMIIKQMPAVDSIPDSCHLKK